jgi:serine/threonine protein kinase
MSLSDPGIAPQRLSQVRALFDAAVEKPVEDRRAFLDEAAGADVSLRDEVLALLADEEAAKGFLSGAAVLPPSLAATTETSIPSLSGRQIGAYHVLDEIGRGGMGAVYRAVRADDAFQKTVALKLVSGGTASDSVRKRFRRERQILARLQHPHIATIFDGGTTEEGQPYLVMEYVEGERIDKYCAEREVATRGRLEMFRQVCGAVHYAHQNLVVHRDLKPDNILVTSEGTPKLLDFGIAKLLAAGVEPDEAPTMTMLPLMTPEYASPEQVRGEVVTTASDVYSLGVVLYELLTGRRPYVVRTESLEEIVRAVCLTEPQAPSAIARTLSAAGTTRPPVAASELRGDLDTIVLKALRKEPLRRYLSAQELAEDIRRHLEGLPLMARADSTAYRVGKFVRRHRVSVAGAALLALSLIGGIVMTVREARIAEAQRARAERRFADVRKLANSFMFDIHDEIRDLPGSMRARERLVATAREYLDSLAQEAHDDAGLQRELAGAYERLGDVQGGGFAGNVGDTKSALVSYHQAVAIRNAIVPAQRTEPDDSKALARVQMRLGDLYRGMSRLPEAGRTYRGVGERLEVLVAGGGAGDLRGRLADAYGKLAEVEVQLGHADVARSAVEKAIQHGEAFGRGRPEDAGAQLNLATAYYVDAERLRAGGQAQRALDRARQARTIHEALLQRDPLNQQLVRALLFSLNREAVNLEGLDRRPEALQVYRRAVDIAEGMLRRDPRDRWAQLAVMVADSALGRALMEARDFAAALVPLGRAREIGVRVVAADPGMGFARDELAVVDSSLGFSLLGLGTPAARHEGCQALERSLEAWRRMQREGQLTADSVTNMRDVETRMIPCQGASR